MNLRNHSSRRLDVGVDMTPLIDIVFLLLIFFLVTTTFTKKRQEAPEIIPINLPSGESGKQVTDQSLLVLSVTEDGRVRIADSEPLEDEELLRELKRRQAEEGEEASEVVLRGDKGSTHGRVIEVLDAVKVAGFSKVNLVVKKKEGVD